MNEALHMLMPVAFTLLVWWAGTLLMLRRSLSAPPRCRRTLGAVSVIAALGVLGLLASRNHATTLGAYGAFLSGMSIWAWLELTYFLGFITGPRAKACPPGVSAWSRFFYGIKTSLYHELSIVVVGVLIILATVSSPNSFAAWTFGLLWVMRWSAKLNIFFGVRNLHQEYWPPHLQYLSSYVRQANMNALFPFSLLGALGVMVLLLMNAFAPDASAFVQTGNLLLTTLLALALLEHVFLMIKVPDGVLWQWAAKDTQGTARAPIRDVAAGQNS